MNIPVHRHTDARVCGATTVVTGQSTVYVNNLLASVQGDGNTHGSGALLANVNDGSVYINGKKLVLLGSGASPDLLYVPIGPPHGNPKASQASPNVFACGGGAGGSFAGTPNDALPDPKGSDLYPDPNAQTVAGDGTKLPRPYTDNDYDPSEFSEADQARIAALEADPAWQDRLTAMEAKYPGLSRNQLYDIINGESNFDPTAKNPSGATGLFQFMPATASDLGYSTDQIAAMSPSQQLGVYDQYLDRYKYNSATHLGIMQAAPAYASRSPNTVVYPIGSAAYKQNPGWRPSDGGHITVQSISDYYNRNS